MRTRLTELLGIEHPVMLAGMGGVSYAPLVAAVSEAGGFGCMGASTMGDERMAAEMAQVRAATSKPFGVDLLTAMPGGLTAQVELIIAGGASAFVAGLGVPSEVVDLCHAHNVVVVSMCGKVAHAVRAVVNPAARDAQPRNGGGGEFRVGVDLRNLLLQRHATQQVFDAFLDGLVGVEIERRWFLNRLNLDRLVLRGLNLGRRLRGRLDLDPRRWGRLVLLGAEECGSQSQQEQPQDTRQTTQAARDEFHDSHSRTVEQGGINASLKLHLHLFALISDGPVRFRGE